MYSVPSIQDRTGRELQKYFDFSSISTSTSQKTNWEYVRLNPILCLTSEGLTPTDTLMTLQPVWSENRCGTLRYMHIYAYSDVYFNYSTMRCKQLVMAYVNFIKN